MTFGGIYVFFLGAETTAPAARYWASIRAQIIPRLSKLQDRSYGTGLDSIYIISIILPNDYFEDGGYKERKRYYKKTQDADIRLRIDFNSFVKAKPNERTEIYINHIIESIQTLKGKVGKDFDFNQLMSDVLSVLAESGSTEEQGNN